MALAVGHVRNNCPCKELGCCCSSMDHISSLGISIMEPYAKRLSSQSKLCFREIFLIQQGFNGKVANAENKDEEEEEEEETKEAEAKKRKGSLLITMSLQFT